MQPMHICHFSRARRSLCRWAHLAVVVTAGSLWGSALAAAVPTATEAGEAAALQQVTQVGQCGGAGTHPLLASALARPHPSLKELVEMICAAEALPLSAADGAPDIALIRRRLAKLEAIRTEASAALHGGSPERRLQARLFVAFAHGRFASALEALPLPASAQAPAARAAWMAQRGLALREARLHAAAHLRSCQALSHALPQAPGAYGSACARLLGTLPNADGPGTFAPELPATPRAIAALRAPELGACLASAAQRTRDVLPERVLARLELDAAGLVRKAQLEGELGSEALKACLERALRLWAFPGLSDVAIELPLQLRLRAD